MGLHAAVQRQEYLLLREVGRCTKNVRCETWGLGLHLCFKGEKGMYLKLCLLFFYAQNLFGRTHKKMVMLAVGGQDCVTQAGEGHSTVHFLVPFEFSNM